MARIFEKKRFVLFLASIFFVSLGSFAQIKKVRGTDSDGNVYYATMDMRKRYNSNCGVQTIDGRQVVPNEYLLAGPLAGTNGKYFKATKVVGDDIFFDALYDSNGNCIIPYTRQYNFLRGHEGWVEVYRENAGKSLDGACNIYTGEELLPPIYERVTESNGKIRGENENSRGEWITVATCEVPKKSSSHYTSSNTSTSRSSKSSSSSSSRQWVPCFFCDGTGNCPDCGGTGMRSTPFGMFQCSPKCGGCGGAGGSWTGSEPTVVGTGGNTINSDTNYQTESRQGGASNSSRNSNNSDKGWYTCCSNVANFGNVTYHTCANCGKSHQRGSGHMCKRR